MCYIFRQQLKDERTFARIISGTMKDSQSIYTRYMRSIHESVYDLNCTCLLAFLLDRCAIGVNSEPREGGAGGESSSGHYTIQIR